MKNIYKLSILTLLVFFVAACDNTELDGLLDNPNAVTPEKAELDLLYNNIMLEFVEFVDEASDELMPYVRMTAMSGGNRYDNQDAPTTFDGLWRKAYSEIIPDIDLVIELASKDGLNTFSGSVKVIKAYILFTLVDMFGDIPFSEAFQGVENPSPVSDDDESVYNAALGILDQAISELGSPKGAPSNDLYYGGNAGKWLKLANSLKLRYLVMTRLVGGSGSAVDALAGNVIGDGEDFKFEYGSNRSTPDSRHPYYSDAYDGGGPGIYMSNYMMWQMFNENDNEDPRLRYYFYRQDCDETDEDFFTLGCQELPYPTHWPAGLPWCTASSDWGDASMEYSGYWGRAHGNNDGIPPDDEKRTVWGLYPAGGSFDANDCKHIVNAGTDGARGAGIQPIFMASWLDFLRAEAALTMGASGDPAALLESGMRKSIAFVMGFESRSPVAAAFKPTAEVIDAFVNEVVNKFKAAATTDEKLNIVINQYRIAAHGNGLEPFNSYRRTGLPKGMQPARAVDPGTFPRTMWYPAIYVNTNANKEQRPDLKTQVFWDTNPGDGFIN